MEESRTTPQVFYSGWREFMDTLTAAIAPLTEEQLALRAKPNQRTVGEIAQHIVAGRVYWFRGFMGIGDASFDQYASWDDSDAPVTIPVDKLVEGLNETGRMMWSLLDKWTEQDMRHTFPHEWRGENYELSRSWVVWHVLEHDLIHAGEVSLTLGMFGIDAPHP